MYNKRFFDAFFNDADDLFEEFNKLVNKFDNETKEDNEKEKKNNNENYYHFLSNKYKNGKCVEHQEKIVDNGKVVKNEAFAIDDKKKEETKTIGSEVIKAKNNEIEKLKAENEILKKENENLKAKIAQIKNLFS